MQRLMKERRLREEMWRRDGEWCWGFVTGG